jgi:hypothetical protein
MAFIKRSSDWFSQLSHTSVFDLAIQFLLVFLPFSSFLSVFLTYRLGIPGTSFIKEIALLVAGLALLYSYVQSYLTDKKYIIKLTRIDYLITTYIISMVVVTLFTTGIRGLAFGGRYDFSFLLTFLIAYHGFPLLGRPISYYFRIFLVSSGLMLFFSGLLRWPFHEDLLLYF